MLTDFILHFEESNNIILLVTYSLLMTLFVIIMIILWFEMRKNMFFYTKGYKAINPYRILLFYFLTAAYLSTQIVIISIVNTDMYHHGTIAHFLHTSSRTYLSSYFLEAKDTIPFYVIMHLNPLNLILKYMILKFDIFTEIAIEVQKYLNTRIYEFNPPNTNENY